MQTLSAWFCPYCLLLSKKYKYFALTAARWYRVIPLHCWLFRARGFDWEREKTRACVDADLFDSEFSLIFQIRASLFPLLVGKMFGKLATIGCICIMIFKKFSRKEKLWETNSLLSSARKNIFKLKYFEDHSWGHLTPEFEKILPTCYLNNTIGFNFECTPNESYGCPGNRFWEQNIIEWIYVVSFISMIKFILVR